jgi:hypothetical protein
MEVTLILEGAASWRYGHPEETERGVLILKLKYHATKCRVSVSQGYAALYND